MPRKGGQIDHLFGRRSVGRAAGRPAAEQSTTSATSAVFRTVFSLTPYNDATDREVAATPENVDNLSTLLAGGRWGARRRRRPPQPAPPSCPTRIRATNCHPYRPFVGMVSPRGDHPRGASFFHAFLIGNACGRSGTALRNGGDS